MILKNSEKLTDDHENSTNV